jgi:Glutamyl-tRNAGlu reductase, N-terminal domain
MKLDSLVVHHLPKSAATQAPCPFTEGFVLESCLRFVGISRTPCSAFSAAGVETYHGPEAYRFLLELACGLHSKMQGESEIFGQMKQAWKTYHAAEPLASRSLHRLMQNLFADTKRLRTAHLHGIGGQSYPGAIQKLLGMRKTDSLLILGAGQFGAMLAEKLRGKVAKLTVLNRSPHPLVAEPGWAQLEENIHAVTHVLVALPQGADEMLDKKIIAAWKERFTLNGGILPQTPAASPPRICSDKTARTRTGALLHLGQMDYAGTNWATLPHFHGLAEVMALQEGQSAARPAAIAAAFAAIGLAVEQRAQTALPYAA